MSDSEVDSAPRAGFFRRLAAMIYDALVAVAVGMLAALVMSATLVALLSNGVIPMYGAEQPSEAISQSAVYTAVLQVWVVLWVTVFFLWFWKKGGQTIGMRAWRLRLFTLDDKPVTWGRLVLRLLASLGGLGTLLVLLDVKGKLALQDRVTNIEMVFLSKHANDHKNW